MTRFRSRVVEVDAVQFDGFDGANAAWKGTARWLIDALRDKVLQPDRRGECVWVKTLEGTTKASPGDWIIKGTEDELYPCKPSIFERKYEPATNPI